ncbi:MAG: FG-GAP-like repeat-containing protein [Planctomycetota bacterium]|jgi:hypothetical protein
MKAIRVYSVRHRTVFCALAAAALVTASSSALDLGCGEPVQTDDQADVVVPGYSVPSFVHWDGDDLKDLVVGEGSGSETARVRVYLNEGTQTEPQFSTWFYVQSNESDLVVPGSGCLGLFPRVAYWDADNRKDLLVGLSDGRTKIYLNTGSDDSPTFDGGTYLLVGEPGLKTEINVGGRATSSIVDWNDDARKDLMTGAVDGKIRVYVNEGTDTEPDFRTEQIVQSNGGDLVVPSLRSSPVLIDFDGDGRRDIVTGNTEGQLLLYVGPSFSAPIALEANGIPIDLTGWPRSRPFVCDWNNNERLDVLVGAGDGLILLYADLHIGDINCDGVVDVQDFLELLAHWGEAGGPADVNDDGIVDVQDFLIMLGNWST